MNIGLIVHSKTGNTLSVAQKLKQALLTAGHSVNLEQVTTVNDDPSKDKNIELKAIPDTNGYDVLIFAAPVWAFSASTVMKLYLSKISSLKGKMVGLFVTQQFPVAWLGGNRAVKQMKQACEAKKAVVYKTGVINWSNKQREHQIINLIDEFKKL